ncbi:MAG: hypothetical protein K6F53_05635 [Lachnospiraceae bacterium]|nr:hypothetical protein [Lachnospiraceae bacterium]
MGRTDKGQSKKRILIGLLLAEVLVFLAVLIFTLSRAKIRIEYDENTLSGLWDQERKELITPPAELPVGIYDVTIDYEAESDIETLILYKQTSRNTVWEDSPLLSRYDKSVTYSVWVNDRCSDFHVKLKDTAEGDATLKTHSITIRTAKNSGAYRVSLTAVWLVVIFGLAWFIGNIGSLSPFSTQILGIGAITLIASLGLFARFVLMGHDLNFHLMRIEGLKDALLMGELPVKVQSNWCFGYGYAVSAMYGDITLILPAIMRILGFTIHTSYKTFVFFINLTTAITAYLCFSKMASGKKYAALLATFMYVCAPYRMCCIYIRAAFGEYSGMMFLPLIFLWMYEIYTGEIEDKSLSRKYILPVMGFTGLIQTHILTCFMLGLFMVVFMLILWKKTFRGRMILHMLKAGGLTILVNLWFLVPLITFLREPLRLHSENGYNPDFQIYGLSIAELFAQHSSGTTGYNWAYFTNLGSRMSMPLGNGFVVLLLIFAWLLWTKKPVKKDAAPGIMAFLGLLSAFMATNVFPYDLIERTLPLISKYITRVNVPYRYITMAVAFLSVFVVFFFGAEGKRLKKKYIPLIIAIVLLVCMDQTMENTYKTLYTGPVGHYYDDICLDTNDLVGYEYLYEDTDYNRIHQENYVTTDNTTIEHVERKANRFLIKGVSAGNNAKLELPLYYYPGYTAKSDSGKSLKVERGTNNRVRIVFDNGFGGNVKVRYTEPLLWRICELTSLAAFVAVILLEIKRRKEYTE